MRPQAASIFLATHNKSPTHQRGVLPPLPLVCTRQRRSCPLPGRLFSLLLGRHFAAGHFLRRPEVRGPCHNSARITPLGGLLGALRCLGACERQTLARPASLGVSVHLIGEKTPEGFSSGDRQNLCGFWRRTWAARQTRSVDPHLLRTGFCTLLLANVWSSLNELHRRAQARARPAEKPLSLNWFWARTLAFERRRRTISVL